MFDLPFLFALHSVLTFCLGTPLQEPPGHTAPATASASYTITPPSPFALAGMVQYVKVQIGVRADSEPARDNNTPAVTASANASYSNPGPVTVAGSYTVTSHYTRPMGSNFQVGAYGNAHVAVSGIIGNINTCEASSTAEIASNPYLRLIEDLTRTGMAPRDIEFGGHANDYGTSGDAETRLIPANSGEFDMVGTLTVYAKAQYESLVQ
jgi:hypothetical protein